MKECYCPPFSNTNVLDYKGPGRALHPTVTSGTMVLVLYFWLPWFWTQHLSRLIFRGYKVINFLPVGCEPLTSTLKGWYSNRWVTLYLQASDEPNTSRRKAAIHCTLRINVYIIQQFLILVDKNIVTYSILLYKKVTSFLAFPT